VTVGAAIFVTQCSDDVAKREEAHVDVDAFLEPLPLSLGLLLPFTACQVHQMELQREECTELQLPLATLDMVTPWVTQEGPGLASTDRVKMA
jgi:hypothetical protein